MKAVLLKTPKALHQKDAKSIFNPTETASMRSELNYNRWNHFMTCLSRSNHQFKYLRDNISQTTRIKHKSNGWFPYEGKGQELPSLISQMFNMNSSHFLWVRVEGMGGEVLIRRQGLAEIFFCVEKTLLRKMLCRDYH